VLGLFIIRPTSIGIYVFEVTFRAHAKINHTIHTRHRIRLQEPADTRFGKSFAAAAVDRPST